MIPYNPRYIHLKCQLVLWLVAIMMIFGNGFVFPLFRGASIHQLASSSDPFQIKWRWRPLEQKIISIYKKIVGAELKGINFNCLLFLGPG